MEGEGFLFAVGEEMDLAGESVSIGVETGAVCTFFALGGGRACGFVGKLGFVPGHGVGDRLLYVKTHLGIPLFTAEHGEIGKEGRSAGMRLKGRGNFIFFGCDWLTGQSQSGRRRQSQLARTQPFLSNLRALKFASARRATER